MSKFDRLCVAPGERARLGRRDPSDDLGWNKEEALALLEQEKESLSELQYRLYAEGSRAVLVVLQGMDTSGKDGVIRHVFSGINPQGCSVVSFKKPSEEELAHDYLWRIHRQVPAKGHIGVFNRSHYEDVLIARVRGLVAPRVWKKRYAQINAFERHLTQCGVTLLKCYLHISKAEQKKRLMARLADPGKRWKFNPQDLEERKLWGAYRRAYEEALTHCSSVEAPWYVIPADRKWVRDLALARLLRRTLDRMNPRYPRVRSAQSAPGVL